MRQLIATLFVAQLVAATAHADARDLNATEIGELLTGNTAIGRWVDHRYRQYFADDGTTIYAQDNVRSAVGRWRINTDTHRYQSWWQQSGWGDEYRIVIENGAYYWVGGGVPPQTFRIVPGQQLVD